MKRDWDLLRSILRRVENEPAGSLLREGEFQFPPNDPKVIKAHVKLAIDLDLLDAGMDKSSKNYLVKELTSFGHDFLALADDDAWAKAKQNPAIFATYDILEEWLTTEKHAKAGLP